MHSQFLLSPVLCSQNILVRQRLLRQAIEREKKEEDKLQRPPQAEETGQTNTDDENDTDTCDEVLSEHSGGTDGTPGSTTETTAPDGPTEVDPARKKEGRRQGLKQKFANMREKRRRRKQESQDKETNPKPAPARPAFNAATYHKASKVPLEPREVVVPYSRVRTERFYDWPPDPAVSRASPVFLAGYGLVDESFIPNANEGVTSKSLARRRVSSGK